MRPCEPAGPPWDPFAARAAAGAAGAAAWGHSLSPCGPARSLFLEDGPYGGRSAAWNEMGGGAVHWM